MVLPAGVNKATGLRAALAETEPLAAQRRRRRRRGERSRLPEHLRMLGRRWPTRCRPSRRRPTSCSTRDHGAGVAELIDEMLADDLASREARAARHDIVLGKNAARQADRRCRRTA